jgi:glycogen phosphorylase
VRTTVDLGELTTDDVLVEIYHGLLDTQGNIVTGETETMSPVDANTQGQVTFAGEIPCRRSGQRGYTVRVTPRNPRFPLSRFETGLIRWFGDEVAARPVAPQGART